MVRAGLCAAGDVETRSYKVLAPNGTYAHISNT